MPDFDIQGRIQSVMQRVQGLRPNILPLPHLAYQAPRGPILGRLTSQALPGGVPSILPWHGRKDFAANGPTNYRGDQTAGNVPVAGNGYRVTT